MDYYLRYDKEVMEPFALKTIGLSFNRRYLEYYSPYDSDNFDYISPNNDKGLEITTVISYNEIEAYVYEKHKAEGKQKLDLSRIKYGKADENGKLVFYFGGTMEEIKQKIIIAINKKQQKAEKRLAKCSFSDIDLCICINDGGLFDLNSFELFFIDLQKYLFKNIFFITSSHFICFNRDYGFKEYPRIIE